MTGRKFKTGVPFTEKEKDAVLFGKICGCGQCKYCHAYEMERVWQQVTTMIEDAERKRPVKWEPKT